MNPIASGSVGASEHSDAPYMRNIVVCLFEVLVLTLSCLSASGRTSLSEAQSAIEANLKSPEGKKFDERLGKEFVATHTSPLRQCRASSGNENASFWNLLNLIESAAWKKSCFIPKRSWVFVLAMLTLKKNSL